MDQKSFEPGSYESSLRTDAWAKLRGALKDVFAEFGGGEEYLRSERANFVSCDEGE
jgi:hypothetical protein